jgi:hypothetical protein
MMDDIAERRGAWLHHRHLVLQHQLRMQQQQQQQQHWHYDSQRYGVVDPPTGSYPVDAAVGATLTAMPATSPSYSIPIPIVSQHPSVAGGQQPQYYYGIMDSDGGRGGGGGGK